MQLFAVVFGLVLLLALLGLGAGLAERWAKQRGRAQAPWILATLGAGALGYGGCALLVWVVLELPTAGSHAMLAGVVGAPLLATLLEAAVLLVLRRLPQVVPRLRGNSWPVFCIERGRDGEEARLVLEGGSLRIEGPAPRVIPLVQIEALEPEGEGLRLRWSGSELVLLPEVGDQGYEAAQRMSRALQRRITSAAAGAGTDGLAGDHPYRK